MAMVRSSIVSTSSVSAYSKPARVKSAASPLCEPSRVRLTKPVGDGAEESATELGDGVADLLGLIPPRAGERRESAADLLPDCDIGRVDVSSQALLKKELMRQHTKVLLLVSEFGDESESSTSLGVSAGGKDRGILHETHPIVKGEGRILLSSLIT